MNLLKKYLEGLFGSKATVSYHSTTDLFPRYLTDRYRFLDLSIHEKSFLLMEPLTEKDPLDAMILHRQTVIGMVGEEVAFLFSSLSEKRKKVLLRMIIPFIVPEKVIFLPSTLFVLEEKKVLAVKTSGFFSPSEQLVCLYLFYRKKNWISGPQVAHALFLSPMSVSRALRGLFAMDALEIQGTSPRQKYRRIDRKAYYDLVKPRIAKPVMTYGYDYSGEFDSKWFRLSGYPALAAQTDLASSSRPVYAFGKGIFTKEEVRESSEPGELLLGEGKGPDMEEWEYDPILLSKNDFVDPLSLVACFAAEREDERVDAACRKLEDLACEESRDFGIL